MLPLFAPGSREATQPGFDLTDAVYKRQGTVTNLAGTAQSLFLKADGTKIYVLNGSSVHEYTLTTPFDVSTIVYASKNVSLTSVGGFIYGFNFSADGTKMYVSQTGSGGKINQYSLSPAWDITTSTFVTDFTPTATPAGFCFADNGSKMYILQSDIVTRYNLSTPWSLATASSASQTKNCSAQLGGNGITARMMENGKKFFALRRTSPSEIFQYSMLTPYVPTSATYDSVSLNLDTQTVVNNDLAFSDNGKNLYVLQEGAGSVNIYQYDL